MNKNNLNEIKRNPLKFCSRKCKKETLKKGFDPIKERDYSSWMSPFHFSFYLNNQGAPHFFFFLFTNLSPFKSWLLFGRCCQRPFYYIQSTCRMLVVTDYSSQIHGFFPKYTKFHSWLVLFYSNRVRGLEWIVVQLRSCILFTFIPAFFLQRNSRL